MANELYLNEEPFLHNTNPITLKSIGNAGSSERIAEKINLIHPGARDCTDNNTMIMKSIDQKTIPLFTIRQSKNLSEYTPQPVNKRCRQTKEYNKFAYARKMHFLTRRRRSEINRWVPTEDIVFGRLQGEVSPLYDDNVVGLVEDLMFLAHTFWYATSISSYMVGILGFMKLRLGVKSIITSVMPRCLDFLKTQFSHDDNLSLQGEFSDLSLDDLRNNIDAWPRIKASPVWRKVNRVLAFCLSAALWGEVKANSDLVVQVEEVYYKSQGMFTMDMAHAIADFVVFMCERGFQCFKSGSIQPLYHSGGTYEKWYDESTTMLTKARFLCNPLAHGIKINELIGDLKRLIEEGVAIQKYATELDKTTRNQVAKTIMLLKVMLANDINRNSVQATRRCPLAVCVAGHSSVAKSTFTDLLHVIYSKSRGLDPSEKTKFTRNCMQEYWDGFTSDKHCIIMDDIASENPGVVQGISPSVSEILNIVGNAAYNFNMAALEDKGSTPCLIEHLIATTNSPDLHAHHYFSCPLAVVRRFAYYIHITPKSQYSNGAMIDPTKLPIPPDGEFADYWDITVYTVAAGDRKSESPADKYKSTFNFVRFNDEPMNIESFTKWYVQAIHKHNEIQDRVLTSCVAMQSVNMCPSCGSCKQCTCEVWSDQVLQGSIDSFGVCDYLTALIPGFILSLCGYFVSIIFGKRWDIFGRFCYMCLRNSMYHSVLVPTRLQTLVFRACLERSVGSIRTKLRFVGDQVCRSFNPTVLMSLVISSSIVTIVILCWGMLGWKGNDIKLQNGFGIRPDSQNEVESAWKKPEILLTNLNMTDKVKSYKGLEHNKVVEIIMRNIATLRFTVESEKKRYNGVATCIGGQYYLLNNHCVPQVFDEVQIVTSRDANYHSNVSFKIAKKDIYRFPDKDLCIVRLRNLPNCRNIVDLFSPSDVKAYRGPAFYLSVSKSGERSEIRVEALKLINNFICPDLGVVEAVWQGTPRSHTQEGFCGSPLVAFTGLGPIILGIHQVGTDPPNEPKVGAVCVMKSFLEEFLKDRDAIEPSVPLLDTPNTQTCVLGQVNDKSPVNYIKDGRLQVYGGFVGFRASPTSKVEKTLFCQPMIDRGFPLKFGPPVMRGWKPWFRALDQMKNGDSKFDDDVLYKCRESIFAKWCSIESKWKDELTIYNLDTVVNGIAGLKYVDSINRDTSAGCPWRKSKKFLLTYGSPTEFHQDPVYFSKDVLDRVSLRLESYSKGIQTHPIFIASLKDEPVKFAKIESCKTRVFMGAPVDFTIAMRQVLLSFVRIVQMNPFLFESAPGMDVHSNTWERLYEYLMAHGGKMIFGDYADYDITMRATVILHVFELIAEFHQHCGCTEEHCRMIRTVGYDIAFAMVDYNGTLVMLFGKNPSGQALTVILNGIVNCLYMRYCYYHLNPNKEVDSFNLNVNLITYGDDNGQGVADNIPWYNHTAIKHFLEGLNIVYTMADKTAESVPYIDIRDADFLKRRFRYDPDFGRIVAPLEVSSIHKMLMIGIRGALTPEEQVVAIAHAALKECAYHGKDFFLEWDTRIRDMVHGLDLDIYLETNPLPTWEKLVSGEETMYLQSDIEDTDSSTSEDSRETLSEADLCRIFEDFQHRVERGLDYCICKRWDCDWCEPDPMLCSFCKHCRDDNDLEPCFRCGITAVCVVCLINPPDTYLNNQCLSCSLSKALEQCQFGEGLVSPTILSITQNSNQNSSPITREVLDSSESGLYNDSQSEVVSSHFILQSEVEQDLEVKGVHTDVEQTAEFTDADVGELITYPSALLSSVNNDQAERAMLANFLSRPVMIKSATWALGGFTLAEFDPWTLFLSTSQIAKKIDNFGFMRGNLHIKITLNASPFYYGYMGCMYTPLPNATLPIGSSTSIDLVPFSQRPHLWIDPRETEAGQMVLPFFWREQYVNLTSAADVAELGSLRLLEYVPLSSANGATVNSVTIHIYAWMENVELMGSTTKLALQGGKDEYIGPVQKVASAIAVAAGAVSKLPFIGPWATATQIGAGALENIAHLFGWTNVPMIGPSEPVKLMAFTGFPSADISEPVDKLLLDPKAELTVDPRILNLDPCDEMETSYILQKESYLAYGTWATADAVGTGIFYMKVNPQLVSNGAASAHSSYTSGYTPMAYLNEMFAAWRGDIVVRLKVICSKYHRGRLRVTFDPLGTLTATTDYSHVAITKIIDIGVSDEVEFTIPYTQSLPWLRTYSTSITNNWSSSSYSAPTYGYDNGTLTVRVLNNLSAPIDTASVRVLVFVKGAPNLEFANPRELNPFLSPLALQGGSDTIANSEPDRYLVNFAEPVMSLRTLLRRTNYYDSLLLGLLAENQNDFAGVITVFQGIAPGSPGYDTHCYTQAAGVETPGSNYYYSYVKPTPLRHVMNMYVGYRGAIRWHYNVESCGQQFRPNIKISRRTHSQIPTNNAYLEGVYTTLTNNHSEMISVLKYRYARTKLSGSGASGGIVYPTYHQPGIAVEYPMMSVNKFYITDPRTALIGTSWDHSDQNTAIIEVIFGDTSGEDSKLGDTTMERYVGIGTDFNLFFFLNVPLMYFNAAAGNVPKAI